MADYDKKAYYYYRRGWIFMVVPYKRYSDFDDWTRQNYSQQDIKDIKGDLDVITEVFFGRHHNVRGKGADDCREEGLSKEYERAVEEGMMMAREAIITLVVGDCRRKSAIFQLSNGVGEGGQRDYSLLLEDSLRVPTGTSKVQTILDKIAEDKGPGKLIDEIEDIMNYRDIIKHEQSFCRHVLPILFSCQEEPWRHCLTTDLAAKDGIIQGLGTIDLVLDMIYS